MSSLFAKFFSGFSAAALVWNLGASACLAHPDHPIQIGASESLLHYFVQPEHSLPLAIFAVAMWWLCRMADKHLATPVPAKKIVQVEDRRRR